MSKSIKDEINPSLLISLVESRPVIWDKTADFYKSKHLIFTAWNQIYAELCADYASIPDKKKHIFAIEVRKKWTNLKDNWLKCHKKIKEYTGLGPKPVVYRYYSQMKFMAKLYGDDQVVDNISITNSDDEEPLAKKIKQEGDTPEVEQVDLDERFTEIQDELNSTSFSVLEPSQIDDSRAMSFFKSIVPTVSRFQENDFVEFQYEVIKIMRKISQGYNVTQSQNHTRNDDNSDFEV